MSAGGKCNEVPSEIQDGKSHIEDRIIKVGKLLHIFQSSGFNRFWLVLCTRFEKYF